MREVELLAQSDRLLEHVARVADAKPVDVRFVARVGRHGQHIQKRDL